MMEAFDTTKHRYDSVGYHMDQIKNNLMWHDQETIHIHIYTRNLTDDDHREVRRKIACERLGLKQELAIPMIQEKGQMVGMHYWYASPEGWKESMTLGGKER